MTKPVSDVAPITIDNFSRERERERDQTKSN
jgi:hypothetical protein